eukprot:gene9850-10896_t
MIDSQNIMNVIVILLWCLCLPRVSGKAGLWMLPRGGGRSDSFLLDPQTTSEAVRRKTQNYVGLLRDFLPLHVFSTSAVLQSSARDLLRQDGALWHCEECRDSNPLNPHSLCPVPAFQEMLLFDVIDDPSSYGKEKEEEVLPHLSAYSPSLSPGDPLASPSNLSMESNSLLGQEEGGVDKLLADLLYGGKTSSALPQEAERGCSEKVEELPTTPSVLDSVTSLESDSSDSLISLPCDEKFQSEASGGLVIDGGNKDEVDLSVRDEAIETFEDLRQVGEEVIKGEADNLVSVESGDTSGSEEDLLQLAVGVDSDDRDDHSDDESHVITADSSTSVTKDVEDDAIAVTPLASQETYHSDDTDQLHEEKAGKVHEEELHDKEKAGEVHEEELHDKEKAGEVHEGEEEEAGDEMGDSAESEATSSPGLSENRSDLDIKEVEEEEALLVDNTPGNGKEGKRQEHLIACEEAIPSLEEQHSSSSHSLSNQSSAADSRLPEQWNDDWWPAFLCGMLATALLAFVARAYSIFKQRYPRQLADWLQARVDAHFSLRDYSAVISDIETYLPTIVRYFGDQDMQTCAFKHSLAQALLTSGKVASALELLEQVHRAYLPYGEDRYLAHVYEDQGLAFRAMGNYDDAVEKLQLALRIFHEEAAADVVVPDLTVGDGKGRSGREDGEFSLYEGHPMRCLPNVHESCDGFTSDSPLLSAKRSSSTQALYSPSSPVGHFYTPAPAPVPADEVIDGERLRVLEEAFGTAACESLPVGRDLPSALSELESLLETVAEKKETLMPSYNAHRFMRRVVDKDVARVSKELGDVLYTMQSFLEARDCYQLALTLGEQLADPEAPELEGLRQIVAAITEKYDASPASVARVDANRSLDFPVFPDVH